MLNHVMVEILRMAWAALKEANKSFVVNVEVNFPLYPLTSFKNVNDKDKLQIGNFIDGEGEACFFCHGGCSHAFKIAYGFGK